MPTTDDGTRIGLGWEVWLILAVLAGVGFVGPLLFGLIGGMVDTGPAGTLSTPNVPLDPSRLAAGISGALVFTLLAVGLIRTTDWRISD